MTHVLTCLLISYEYLHDATSNLNVCLSMGKAWKFIDVLAMTFTLKRIITSLKTKKQIITLIVHPLFSLLLRRFVFRMAERASAKRVTGDEPQGTMGRLSPSRLPLRAHFNQKRDVWVRGSPLFVHSCVQWTVILEIFILS